MRSPLPPLLLALAALALSACSVRSDFSTEDLYRRSLQGSFDPAGRAERMADVRRALDADVAPRERLFGALLLLDSGAVSDLERAFLEAERAADAGLEAARPVMAQAIDRALVLQGYAQKFGTQYVRDEDGVWQLYRVDPATTDAERAAYGVPSLAEARAGAQALAARR
ncbi:MAG: hypothetical protein WD226_05680 [Planctomycetota bacterium]